MQGLTRAAFGYEEMSPFDIVPKVEQQKSQGEVNPKGQTDRDKGDVDEKQSHVGRPNTQCIRQTGRNIEPS